MNLPQPDPYDPRANSDRWPTPTEPEPDDDTLEFWVFDGVCEATDGCPIEPDGVCEHGHPSWFLYLGII